MHLRRGLCATTAILVLAAPAASGSPVDDAVPDTPTDDGPTAAQSGDVMVIDNEFDPEGLTVTEGTTVVWEQTGDNPHTVTADDGSFDSHPNCPTILADCMMNGDTYEVTFDEAGQVPYFCKVHGGEGGQGMSGVITVEPATSGTDDPSEDTAGQAAETTTSGDDGTVAGAPSAETASGDPLPVTGGGVSSLAGSAMLVGATALLYVTRRRGARGGDGGT